ncbi:MAG: hypothetical protein OEV37_00590 [Candidatus Berkelbacteria bacterium]|nr:hypothetical protein [Candidatus Berkelbacteria bacterium]
MGIFVAITVLYGFMMQREKIMAALLSCYLGMVIVSTWSDKLQAFFEGKKTVANTWIAADASPATIKIVVFLLIVALVAAKADIGIGRDTALAPIELLAYSFITGVLISATVFSYLPEATQVTIISQTKLVHFLKDYYTFWLIAPVILIVFVTSRRRNH